MENFIKNLSHKRKHRETPRHRVITYRILFTLALVAFVFNALSGIVEKTDQPINSNASTTRSETDQLKSQIALLQIEKAALQNELQRYIDTYGEFEDETQDDADSAQENAQEESSDDKAEDETKSKDGVKTENKAKSADDAKTQSDASDAEKSKTK